MKKYLAWGDGFHFHFPKYTIQEVEVLRETATKIACAEMDSGYALVPKERSEGLEVFHKIFDTEDDAKRYLRLKLSKRQDSCKKEIEYYERKIREFQGYLEKYEVKLENFKNISKN